MRAHFILIIILAFSLPAGADEYDDFCQQSKNMRLLMDLISSNIANVNTTRTPEGGPYLRKELICGDGYCDVVENPSTLMKYLPGHPDANIQGYVEFPNINITAEIDLMVEASRKYEFIENHCK